MTCRNQLMNEGKPYGKSGCDICGSILFGGVCRMSVLPDPPKGSNLELRHYVPVGPAQPLREDKYAVIYSETVYHEGDQRSRDCPGHGYPAWQESIEKIHKFPTKEAMKEWILKNETGFGRKTFKAIKYQELSVKTEVVVNV